MEETTKNKLITPIISFFVGLIGCFLFYRLPINYGHDILALLLTTMAGFYFGIIIVEKKGKTIILESFIFSIIMIIAFTGLYYFFIILGAGYLLLGIWSSISWFRNKKARKEKSVFLSVAIINLVIFAYIIFINI